jgi:hypothetical protein
MSDLIGHHRISIRELGSRFGRGELLKDHKDKEINRDYQVDNVRRCGSALIIIADW